MDYLNLDIVDMAEVKQFGLLADFEGKSHAADGGDVLTVLTVSRYAEIARMVMREAHLVVYDGRLFNIVSVHTADHARYQLVLTPHKRLVRTS